MARILLTTFGSLGDLHPYLAIGLGLKSRGHEVVLATNEFYRERIEPLGIGFRPVRPHLSQKPDPLLVEQAMDARHGSEMIVRDLIMPVVRESFEDLLAAAEGADLLLSHPLTYAARLVAEAKALRWASGMIAPLGFFSAWDPPVLAPLPFFARLRFLGPRFHRPLFGLLKWTARSWAEPWRKLRAEIGLPPTREDPVFEGQHSPFLVLALFSKLLAPKAADWPRQTVVTGYPFYDGDGGGGLPSALAGFLAAGPPPIVFTLGSSAVMVPGSFYEESAEAARLLDRRAVLLIGKDSPGVRGSLPPGVESFDYAPFSRLFPRAAAIVHQGGAGTTAEAMRAGRPMLVMPFAHDQQDNAERVRRLGIARVLSRRRYRARRSAAELRRLLASSPYAERAEEVASSVRAEDGVKAACDALEGLLGARRGAVPATPAR
jgi:UDP:flavonoid glycosyltransferase YjiC (YdhE family)